MKKILICIVLFLSLYLVSCNNKDPNFSLSLSGELNNEYDINEEVSLKEYYLIVSYENKETEEISLDNELLFITGATKVNNNYFLNTNNVGSFILTITYKEKNWVFNYKVLLTDIWDGNIKKITPINNVYEISSVSEFAYIASISTLENPFTGKIKLKANLDFNLLDFPTIKYVLAPFEFNGDTFKILGLNKDFSGLIDNLIYESQNSESVIKNIKIPNINIDTFYNTSILIKNVNANNVSSKLIIDDISINGKIITTTKDVAGGLLGSLTNTNHMVVDIKNTFVDLELISITSLTGIFIGDAYSAKVFIDDTSLKYLEDNSFVYSSGALAKFLIGSSSIEGAYINHEKTNDNSINKSIVKYNVLSMLVPKLQNIGFYQVRNAHTAVIYFMYTHDDGKQVIFVERLDVSSFEQGTMVLTNIKNLYVTQDISLKDNPDYYYEENKDYIIDEFATIGVILFNKDNELLRVYEMPNVVITKDKE